MVHMCYCQNGIGVGLSEFNSAITSCTWFRILQFHPQLKEYLLHLSLYLLWKNSYSFRKKTKLDFTLYFTAVDGDERKNQAYKKRI